MVDQSKNNLIHAYFNYSFILPDTKEETKEILILGHYIIQNFSTETLNTPVICIRVKPANAGNLGGKINFKQKGDLVIDGTSSEEWTYVEKNWKEKLKETGEHWLRPSNKKQLSPGEKLIFSNFDLSCIKVEGSNSVIIEAFVYFQEIKEGIPSLNNIVVNF